jgi:hypothetical protein
MSRVPEEHPATFLDFVSIIEREQSFVDGPLWFRGAGKVTYSLLPTLYRHPRHRGVPALEDLERKLMVRFRQRSIPFVTHTQKDDWDVLFFMQHYSVPTRLLDWTENPLVGLYFAVMSSPFSVKTTKRSGTTLKFSSDAALWILNPAAWNSHALRHQSFDRGILAPGDEALQGYKPLTKFSDMNMHPVGLYGAHNSPRIVAQRGAFTIFGQSTRGMEQAFDTEAFPDGCLLKLVLAKDALPKIRASILNQGITESVVFPDLEGLAKEIKRSFSFEH